MIARAAVGCKCLPIVFDEQMPTRLCDRYG